MKNSPFKDFILDQMRDLEDVNAKPMFGGFGFYRGPVFFGILFRERLYFKTDKETEKEYKKLGAKPFIYKRKGSSGRKKQASLHSYFELPADILEDQDRLVSWARTAVSVQENILASEKKRKTQKRSS